jgi:hypothetical protein
VNLTNVVFSQIGNSASRGGKGGAVYFANIISTITITNGEFNYVFSSEGALYFGNGTVFALNCIIYIYICLMYVIFF